MEIRPARGLWLRRQGRPARPFSPLCCPRLPFDCFEQSATGLLSYVHEHEALGGVQVVFSGFINDAQAADLRGLHVRQDAIDLPYFQVFARPGRQTDSEADMSFLGLHRSQSNLRLTFILRRPLPWASYQCSSALCTSPLGKRTNAKPLSLRQRRLRKTAFSSLSSRIERLTATISTSVILPTNSKSSPISTRSTNQELRAPLARTSG